MRTWHAQRNKGRAAIHHGRSAWLRRSSSASGDRGGIRPAISAQGNTGCAKFSAAVVSTPSACSCKRRHHVRRHHVTRSGLPSSPSLHRRDWGHRCNSTQFHSGVLRSSFMAKPAVAAPQWARSPTCGGCGGNSQCCKLDACSLEQLCDWTLGVAAVLRLTSSACRRCDLESDTHCETCSAADATAAATAPHSR